MTLASMPRPARLAVVHGGCLAMIVAAASMSASASAAMQPDLPDLEVATITGPGPNANFGRRVAGIGDFNGNGFEDIAISAPYVNNGAGAVYIHFGGREFFDTTPDLVLFGQAADDQFGISVAGNLDLNGDGHADLAVGARFSNLGANNAGAVFIYFGGPSANASPDVVLVGENADDWFGQSVSAAGDLNGDGFDDLIVGAPYNDDAGNAAGKAYIFHGGAPMSTTPALALLGASVNHAHFGWSVSGAGDVNGDGFDDVVVGARLHGQGPFQARGRAYVFHGGASMATTPALVIEGEFAQDWFGEAVAGVGDVNGDGFDDVVIGAHFADPNGSASGKAYLFLGGAAGLSATPHATFAGPEADAQLGFAVGAAGDHDGDGFDDVILGAHFANGVAGNNVGKAFVIRGGPTIANNQFDIVLQGEAPNDQFGESVGRGGSVANGASAFLVGAHLNTDAGAGAGKAYVYRLAVDAEPVVGDLNGDGVVDGADLGILLSAWGPCPPPGFVGVACVGDLNGDGVVDGADLGILLANWTTASR